RMYSRTLVAPFMLLATNRRIVLSFSALSFRRFVDFDVAHARQAFRIVTTQKFNQTFAHFAAQIERLARVGAADKRAHFDRALLGVGDLQPAYSSVPLRIVLDQPFQFLAQFA